MSEEEKEVIEFYSMPANEELSFVCDFDTAELLEALGLDKEEMRSFEDHVFKVKTLIKLIMKQEGEIKRLKGNKLIDDTKCLRCGSGKPGYCEDCFQKLIAENAELQKERDGIYVDYQDIGKEKCMNEIAIGEKVKAIKKLADEIFDIC